MLRSKKVRSSRRLDEELAAKEAEDEKTKKKVKKTRSSINLGKAKLNFEEEGEGGSTKQPAPAKVKDREQSKQVDKNAKKSSSGKRQKIKVQFEIVFVNIRNLPAKMHEDGSSVLVRWKSSTKKKIVDGSGVRSKAETQAVEVKAGGKAGWEGVGSGGGEGEKFLFEEKLKYDEGTKTFDSKSIELVLKEIKGKKKNHLHKLKVDVGEFARNGSTTKKEITFGKPSSKSSSKDDSPILNVIFRARWMKIDNKVLVKKYGSGENGKQEEDYDLMTVDESDMSESEAESDSDFSESESDLSESDSDLGSDSESESENKNKKKSSKGGKKGSNAELEKANKKCKKLEARCKQLETILLETKRELAEKKVDNMQLQRQLKEKEDQLMSTSTTNGRSTTAAASPLRTSGSDVKPGDLKKAVEERDLRIERLEVSLKSKDDEIKAVKSLFQTEIEELKRKKTSNKKEVDEDDDDDDDDDDVDDDQEEEEEWQMKVDRVAALYDFKARNEQEITLAKDEEFYATDRDPFGVGTFASEWWRVVRRNKDARPSDASDPGKARQEGLAPITYFRVTRPAQKEFSFKMSTKRSASIAELQRHCGFVSNGGAQANKKKDKAKAKAKASSPTKKNESEDHDDEVDSNRGDDDEEEGGNKLKSYQKDRPMQQGKRLPSRFLSLRRKAKDRMKLGDLDDGGNKSTSSPNKKAGAAAAVTGNQGLSESTRDGMVRTKEVYVTSDAEANRVLRDLQRERDWRDVIERAVYCADVTQFVAISSGPTFSSSSAATPTRASAAQRSNEKKKKKKKPDTSDSDSDNDNDASSSSSSSTSSRSGYDDEEREDKMLAGVHEIVTCIKSRKVFEDPETSLSFVRPLCTALRATAQRSKSDFRMLASVLAFTTALLHCMKAQKNYLHLPPFSDDRDKFFQVLFVDPREDGIVTFTEDVPKRKKLLKVATKKVESLSESDERTLGSYKLLVRTLVVLSLDVYLALLKFVEKEIGAPIIPAMLEQPPDFFHLFMNKGQFSYTRPEDVLKQLTRLHSMMVAAGVWAAVLRQFFVDVFQMINARLFNAVVERSDLCTSGNGFQIKTAISHLTQWADSTRFLDAIATKKQLAHITEVASLLVLDMSVLSNEADVRDAFPTLTPKQLLHFASSIKPDSSSGGVPRESLDVLRKMAAGLPQQQGRSGTSPPLKLDSDVPPLVPSKEDYRQPTRSEHIIFRETL